MTDRLTGIEEVESYFPKLLVAEADGGEQPASVYEEADGLETICTIPGYYSAEAQNKLAHTIANMRDNHTALLGAVRAVLAECDATDTETDEALQSDLVNRIRAAINKALKAKP
jgi:hypothetical protein